MYILTINERLEKTSNDVKTISLMQTNALIDNVNGTLRGNGNKAEVFKLSGEALKAFNKISSDKERYKFLCDNDLIG